MVETATLGYIAGAVGFGILCLVSFFWQRYVKRRQQKLIEKETARFEASAQQRRQEEIQMQRFAPRPAPAPVHGHGPPPPYRFQKSESSSSGDEGMSRPRGNQPIIAAIFIPIPVRSTSTPTPRQPSIRPSPNPAEIHERHLESKQRENADRMAWSRRGLEQHTAIYERQIESTRAELDRGWADLQRQIDEADRLLTNKKHAIETQQMTEGRRKEWENAVRDYERKQKQFRQTRQNLQQKQRDAEYRLKEARESLQRQREHINRGSEQANRELRTIQDRVSLARRTQY